MKEATGELNMTVITIVAIAAIAAFFYAFVWPGLQKSIATNQAAAEWGVESAVVECKKGTSGSDRNKGFTCECTDTETCPANARPITVGDE